MVENEGVVIGISHVLSDLEDLLPVQCPPCWNYCRYINDEDTVFLSLFRVFERAKFVTKFQVVPKIVWWVLPPRLAGTNVTKRVKIYYVYKYKWRGIQPVTTPNRDVSLAHVL